MDGSVLKRSRALDWGQGAIPAWAERIVTAGLGDLVTAVVDERSVYIGWWWWLWWSSSKSCPDPDIDAVRLGARDLRSWTATRAHRSARRTSVESKNGSAKPQ